MRNFEAERLGGLEVDDEVEDGWLHDREVRWLLALENASRVKTQLTICSGYVNSVADQASINGELPISIDRGDRMAAASEISRSRRLMKAGSAPTRRAPLRISAIAANTVARSRSLVAFRTRNCSPRAPAVACTTLVSDSV